MVAPLNGGADVYFCVGPWQGSNRGAMLCTSFVLKRKRDRSIGDAEKRANAPAHKGINKFAVGVDRLRARRGSTLLGSLLKRIKRADILVFDISTMNANVLFELGYAMAIKGSNKGRVFVFCREDCQKKASDLQGIFFTFYGPRGLQDQQGFHAAMRSSIIDAARKHDMWKDATVDTWKRARSSRPPLLAL